MLILTLLPIFGNTFVSAIRGKMNVLCKINSIWTIFFKMVALRLIPCLDVANGRVVKGVNFVNLRDSGDPVELACKYSDEGADELVFLDIRASVENRRTLIDLVSRTAKSVKIPFTVGGGIDSISSINDLLRAGADKVSLNSSAVKNPDLIYKSSEQFGSQCIVIAIDARRKLNKCNEWDVYIKGGRENTGLDVLNWAKKVEELGAGEILLTSMDGDGTQNGYDLLLTQSVANAVNIPVIASGGAGCLDDIYDVFKEGKASAALLASLLHDKKLTINEIKTFLLEKELLIRPNE
jgi:cyclase